MTKLYLSLFAFLPFAPPLLAVAGALVSLQLSRRRWIIHALTLAAIPLTLPIYVHFRDVFDPTTVSYPGPGDGFVGLLYLVISALTVIAYLIFCFINYVAIGECKDQARDR